MRQWKNIHLMPGKQSGKQEEAGAQCLLRTFPQVPENQVNAPYLKGSTVLQ
jgi:hypothetical protein